MSKLSNALTIERDEYVYRSYLCLGQYNILQNEIKDNAPHGLQAIKLLCNYICNQNADNNSDNENIIGALHKLLTTPSSNQSTGLYYAVATIKLYENNLKEALGLVKNSPSIELYVLHVHHYVS